MFDWHKVSKDPMNAHSFQKLKEFLLSIRSVLFMNRDEFLLSECKNKSVLDIGPCEHTFDYVQQDGWFFRKAQKVAKKIVGVDINKELCEKISSMGFDVRNIDACSDHFLGEKFDLVLAGDVIEHVNNLVSILEFAKRHISDDGKIIFTTPNPFFYKHFLSSFNQKVCVANFEHTCWITPSCMNELCRRTGLEFSQYIMIINPGTAKHYMMKMLPFTKNWIESSSKEYIYVLKKPV